MVLGVVILNDHNDVDAGGALLATEIDNDHRKSVRNSFIHDSLHSGPSQITGSDLYGGKNLVFLVGYYFNQVLVHHNVETGITYFDDFLSFFRVFYRFFLDLYP